MKKLLVPFLLCSLFAACAHTTPGLQSMSNDELIQLYNQQKARALGHVADMEKDRQDYANTNHKDAAEATGAGLGTLLVMGIRSIPARAAISRGKEAREELERRGIDVDTGSPNASKSQYSALGTSPEPTQTESIKKVAKTPKASSLESSKQSNQESGILVKEVNISDLIGTWEDLIGNISITVHKDRKITGKGFKKGVKKTISGNLNGNVMHIVAINLDDSDKKETTWTIRRIFGNRLLLRHDETGRGFFLERVQ